MHRISKKRYRVIEFIEFPEMCGPIEIDGKEVLIYFDEIDINTFKNNLNIVEEFLYSKQPNIERDPTFINNKVHIEYTGNSEEYYSKSVLRFFLERIETDDEYNLRLGQEIDSYKSNQEFKCNKIISDIENIDDKELITKVINTLTKRLSIL